MNEWNDPTDLGTTDCLRMISGANNCLIYYWHDRINYLYTHWMANQGPRPAHEPHTSHSGDILPSSSCFTHKGKSTSRPHCPHKYTSHQSADFHKTWYIVHETTRDSHAFAHFNFCAITNIKMEATPTSELGVVLIPRIMWGLVHTNVMWLVPLCCLQTVQHGGQIKSAFSFVFDGNNGSSELHTWNFMMINHTHIYKFCEILCEYAYINNYKHDEAKLVSYMHVTVTQSASVEESWTQMGQQTARLLITVSSFTVMMQHMK